LRFEGGELFIRFRRWLVVGDGLMADRHKTQFGHNGLRFR
jgi:hypothetical protein